MIMLLFFVAAILLTALVISDGGALQWTVERSDAFRRWLERRS